MGKTPRHFFIVELSHDIPKPRKKFSHPHAEKTTIANGNYMELRGIIWNYMELHIYFGAGAVFLEDAIESPLHLL